MPTLAYSWDTVKLGKLGKIVASAGPEWTVAADLALWCLQGRSERRPQSMEQVLAHRFFNPEGKLHHFASMSEPMDVFVRRQATLVHSCVEAGQVQSVRGLFAAGGVHVSVPLPLGAPKGTAVGVSLLHRAARHGHLAVVQLLISEVPTGSSEVLQCLLDARDTYGYTALHWAASYNQVDIALELIVHGCSTALYNHRGKTAWDVAIQMENTAVADAFEHRAVPHYAQRTSVLLPAPAHIYYLPQLPAHFQPHTALHAEHTRRGRRPDVNDVYRDDIELDHRRLVIWDAAKPFEKWTPLAEGGFGVVYKVDDVSPPIQVCINVPVTEGLSMANAVPTAEGLAHTTVARQFRCIAVKVPKPGGVKELKAEVEGLSKLAHKNVVAILGMCEGRSPHNDSATTWMMCLEYCASDLRKLLYDKHDRAYRDYSWALMGQLCRHIVDGMAYVHAEQRLHLDLKPENILLVNDGTTDAPVWVAKCGDFGWVPELTQDEWTGTPLYMAPEFAIRSLELDKMGVDIPGVGVGRKADVFSFGVLLWEMFERQTPLDALTVAKGVGVPQCMCTEKLQQTAEGETAVCLRKVSMWMVGETMARPAFSTTFPAQLRALVEDCWSAQPTSRPMFASVQQAFAATDVPWFTASAPMQPQTVQQWMEMLGLDEKLDVLTPYLGDAETIQDPGFVEFMADADEYIDEMADDDELTQDETTRLKEAVAKLRQPQPALRAGSTGNRVASHVATPRGAAELAAGKTTEQIEQIAWDTHERRAQDSSSRAAAIGEGVPPVAGADQLESLQEINRLRQELQAKDAELEALREELASARGGNA
jgi:serine/threonine protein kinase